MYGFSRLHVTVLYVHVHVQLHSLTVEGGAVYVTPSSACGYRHDTCMMPRHDDDDELEKAFYDPPEPRLLAPSINRHNHINLVRASCPVRTVLSSLSVRQATDLNSVFFARI